MLRLGQGAALVALVLFAVQLGGFRSYVRSALSPAERVEGLPANASADTSASPIAAARAAPAEGSPALPTLDVGALSDAEVAARFANASFIRKESAAFARRCGRYSQEWEKLTRSQTFTRLDRVLVIDVSRPKWNGLGNSMDRWLNLLRLGHAHGRATFLRMDPCSPPLPPHSGETDPRPPPARAPACKFDLGAHFEAEAGWSWRWDVSAAARVRAAMARGAPEPSAAGGGAHALWPAAVMRYTCLRQSWTCLNGSLLDAASGSALVPWMGELEGGLWGPKLFALFGEADTAARREGERRAAARGGGAQAAALLRPASVVVLELTNEQTSLQLAANHESVRAAGSLYRGGGWGMCERHSLTRPRMPIQRALLPALAALEGADVAVAMHVRTGYADWQRFDPEAIARGQRNAAAGADGGAGGLPRAYAPASHGAHWAEVERLLLDCSEASASSPAGSPAASPFCFRYHMGPPPFIEGRSVDATDAARCALPYAQPKAALQPPAAALAAARRVMAALPAIDSLPARRGPLAASVACAAMFGRRLLGGLEGWMVERLSGKGYRPLPANASGADVTDAEARAHAALDAAVSDAANDARWRLLVLGDAPAVHAVLLRAPYLRGRAVSLEFDRGAGRLGHTVYAASCSSARGPRARRARLRRRRLGERGGACVQGADPGGAWSRSIADLYLGGLGSAMVRLLFSTYPSAVLMRSVLLGGSTSFYADYGRSSHRDRPPLNLTALAVLGAVGPYDGEDGGEGR